MACSVGGAAPRILLQYFEHQNRPVQGTARPWAGLPARTFTTAVNGGALARNSVAPSAGPGHRPSRRVCDVHSSTAGADGGRRFTR